MRALLCGAARRDSSPTRRTAVRVRGRERRRRGRGTAGRGRARPAAPAGGRHERRRERDVSEFGAHAQPLGEQRHAHALAREHQPEHQHTLRLRSHFRHVIRSRSSCRVRELLRTDISYIQYMQIQYSERRYLCIVYDNSQCLQYRFRFWKQRRSGHADVDGGARARAGRTQWRAHSTSSTAAGRGQCRARKAPRACREVLRQNRGIRARGRRCAKCQKLC